MKKKKKQRDKIRHVLLRNCDKVIIKTCFITYWFIEYVGSDTN